MKKSLLKRLLTVALAMVITVSLAPVMGQMTNGVIGSVEAKAESHNISNPRVYNVENKSGYEDVKTTWDCIWFGRYPQNDSTGETKESIKWRVLSVNGNEAFIVADQILDCKQYNAEKADVTWENCTLRTWLNDEFYNSAFDGSEKAAILTSTVVNDDNPTYETFGGSTTEDKIFLLSLSDVTNTSYGFSGIYGGAWFDSAGARTATITPYVADYGCVVEFDGLDTLILSGEGFNWWLRSPGSESRAAAYVGFFGDVYENGRPVYNVDYSWDYDPDTNPYHQELEEFMVIHDDGLGVRPAMRIDLSFDAWSYAGTVSYDCAANETDPESDEEKDEPLEQHTSISSVLAADQNDPELENINAFLSKKKYAVSTGVYPTFAQTENFIVPGLIQTNTVGDTCTNMIPQGITKAGQYILISAYCSNQEVASEEEKCSEAHDSVIYVCDLSGNYLKTLVLSGLKIHAGGLAYNYDDNVVYIAHSSENEKNNCVEQLPMDTIDSALRSSKDAVLVTTGEGIPIGGTTASYIFYYGHRLYVGQHSKEEEKNWLTSYAVKKEKTDGKDKIYAEHEDKIYLDAKTQGALIFSRNGEDYLLVSSSLGRNNTSKMYLYNITKAMEDSSGSFLVLKKKKVIPYCFPNMSEDIMLMNGKLYTVFESAGALYRENLDGKGKGSAPIDRVLLSDMFGIGKLYHALLINNLWNNLTVSVSSVPESKEYTGNCGDDLYYDIDKDGNMNINGYGEMYDSPFTEEELAQVKHVYIGHEALSVGADAFRGADNLQDVYLSVLSSEEDTFMIGENAFADCPALNAVTLPDKRYVIEDSAFDNDGQIQLKSDADDVQTFCEEKKIGIHTHQFEYIEAVAASPESGGYDLYRCSCGEEEARNATEADPDAPSLIVDETESAINNIEEATVELGKDLYIFDGQEKKPAVTVTYEGNKLTEGTDYTVSYVNNVKVGLATLTVTGKGDYTRTKEITFRIQFKDVTDPTAFYYDPIYWAVDNSIVGGWEDGTYRPMNEANRAAVVTFLWRMKGKPEPRAQAKFSDMTGNPEFDKAISWASENGIVKGWDDNTFRPWQTCNRAAIVTFLWRYAGKPTVSSKAGFKDMTGDSDFDKAISWAASKGITTGWSDNTFRPWDTCKRLAIVSFLNRYKK